MKLRKMIEGCADLQNEWCWFALLQALLSFVESLSSLAMKYVFSE